VKKKTYHGLLTLDTVRESNTSGLVLATSDTSSLSTHNGVFISFKKKIEMKTVNPSLVCLGKKTTSWERVHSVLTEVHSEDTDSGIVLDSHINVFVDSESKVTGSREVLFLQLVLLDLQTTLEDLLGFGSSDRDVNGDLLVTTDTESSDGVTGLRGDGSLTSQLFENLGGTSKPVTRLSDGDV